VGLTRLYIVQQIFAVIYAVFLATGYRIVRNSWNHLSRRPKVIGDYVVR